MSDRPKYKAITTFFFFYFCLSTLLFSANNYREQIDSLQQYLPAADDINRRLELYSLISYYFHRHSVDSMAFYHKKALELIEAGASDPATLRKAYTASAIIKSQTGEPTELILTDYLAAKKYAEQSGDLDGLLACYNNLGYFYHVNYKPHKALESFFLGLQITNENPELNSSDKYGFLNGNIGYVYQTNGLHEKSLDYFKEVLVHAKKIDNLYLYGIYVDNYARALLELGEEEQATAELRAGMLIQKEIGDMASYANSLNTLGEAYLKMGFLDKGLETIEKSQALISEQKFRELVGEVTLVHLKLLKANGDYQKGIEIGEAAYEHIAASGIYPESSGVAELLAELYELENNSTKSSFYQKEYIRFNKKLTGTGAQMLIAKFESDYQEQLREKIEVLNKDQQRQRNIRLIILSVALLLVVFLVYIFILYKRVRNNGRRLLEKNEELDGMKNDLVHKNTELQEYIDSNRQLEEFAHIAAHDIKAPLRTIASYIGLLRHKDVFNNKEQALELFGYVEGASKKLSALVNDLLNFSKVGSEMPNFEALNAEELIKEVLFKIKVFIEEKNAIIDLVDLPNNIIGDALKLELVFQNLITNAIKFCPEDRKPQVLIQGSSTEEEHLLKIIDNGIGIPPEKLDIIFTPFKRLHSYQKFQGHGLGLSICKKLIQQHQGRIEVESKIEFGTTFTIYIPKFLEFEKMIEDEERREIG